ncbi:MAG: hypothetical protein SGCHY_005374 [Lobulomycetales sp.]
MQLIGLTGSIATGRQHDVKLVDADLIARKVLLPGAVAFDRVARAFPEAFNKAANTLDRECIGSIIFNDPERRSQLNKLTHPYIRREILRQVLAAFISGASIVIADVPLLFESRLNHWVHTCVLVYCPLQVQCQRLMDRNGISRTDALARINSQMSIELKRDLADIVLDNSGDFDQDTIPQITDMLSKIRPSRVSHTAAYVVLIIPALLGYALLSLADLLRI